jgi:hypothetical protein
VKKRVKIPRGTKKATQGETQISIREIFRQYGLPEFMIKTGKTSLRYRSPLERGILWYWFSRYIREVRDKDKPCINCIKEKEDYQGGHFILAGSVPWDEMVFDESNVHKECSNCNLRDKRKLGYGVELDKRYPGLRAELECRYELFKRMGTYKNWNRQQYIEKIAHYRSLVEV